MIESRIYYTSQHYLSIVIFYHNVACYGSVLFLVGYG
jgi:hypothetical protein